MVLTSEPLLSLQGAGAAEAPKTVMAARTMKLVNCMLTVDGFFLDWSSERIRSGGLK